MTDEHWTIWGASERGPSHARADLPNQDAWRGRRFPGGSVLVVSDGVGSCVHAELGARAVCQAVCAAAQRWFDTADAWEETGFIETVHARWEELLVPFDPTDCSATCLFVVARRGGVVHAGMLGDGLLAVCRADGDVELWTEDKEESFRNLTWSMASPGAANRWRTASYGAADCDAFVLCTDGIAEDLRPEAAADFVRAVVQHHAPLRPLARRRELRRWLRGWPVAGHADDKTLACLSRAGGFVP